MTGRMAVVGMLVALSCAGGGARAADADFDKIVQSRFVHCAFYRHYEVEAGTGNLLLAEGRSDSLVHFQGIAGGTARAIDTRRSGGRAVRVVRTAKYLHFIDDVAGMYVMTTVYGCIDRDERRGMCITYGAVHARHFDARAVNDPDAVFEDIRDAAEPGFCDHSFIGVQEAAR